MPSTIRAEVSVHGLPVLPHPSLIMDAAELEALRAKRRDPKQNPCRWNREALEGLESGVSRPSSASRSGSGDRTRTYNKRIMIPLLCQLSYAALHA